jgi:hypothetical protein
VANAELWFVLVALSVSGCKDLGSAPPADTEKEPAVELRITPSAGRVGSVLVIHDTRFAAGTDYWIEFPGTGEAVRSDSATDSTAYTFIPFGATSGPIRVDGWSWTGLTGRFTVTESVDTLALSTVHYDLSVPVTANDAWVNYYPGRKSSWQAERKADTVHLWLACQYPEQYEATHLVLIDRGSGRLPEMASVWVDVRTDYSVDWKESIPAGLVKIQQFDGAGVVCGRFFGKPSIRMMLNGTFTFYVDLAPATGVLTTLRL